MGAQLLSSLAAIACQLNRLALHDPLEEPTKDVGSGDDPPVLAVPIQDDVFVDDEVVPVLSLDFELFDHLVEGFVRIGYNDWAMAVMVDVESLALRVPMTQIAFGF